MPIPMEFEIPELERIVRELRLPKEDFTLDYSKVPEKYHASRNPKDMLVLYKGAVVGLQDIGFLANTITRGLVSHIRETKELLESGDLEKINKIVDAHTWYHLHTPFLSTTFNPELAQVFAPPKSSPIQKHNYTIYRLLVPANRCILDVDDTGCSGKSGEVLVLGRIYPHDITAVKIINDDEHSELLCDWMIKWNPDKDSACREVKDPANWKELRK